MVKIKRFFILLGMLGAMQFLLLSTLAIQQYDGGAMHFPNADSFSYKYNFFSDLGRTRNFRGEPILLSRHIFQLTILITGGCTIAFFLVFSSFFQGHSMAKILSVIACFLGIISGLGFMGIAITPWNEMYWSHFYYVRLSFTAFLLMSLMAMIAIYIHPRYPNFYGYIFLVFILILAAYLLILFFGEHPRRSSNALLWRALSQKVVVYSQIICMLIQGIGAWRQLNLYQQ